MNKYGASLNHFDCLIGNVQTSYEPNVQTLCNKKKGGAGCPSSPLSLKLPAI